MTISFAQILYSWEGVIAIAIISFGLGLLFKMAVIRKQRKRILALEDEMLSNHAKILALEKNWEGALASNGSGSK